MTDALCGFFSVRLSREPRIGAARSSLRLPLLLAKQSPHIELDLPERLRPDQLPRLGHQRYQIPVLREPVPQENGVEGLQMRDSTSAQRLQGIVLAALLAPSITGCSTEPSSSGSGGGTTGTGAGGGGFVAPAKVQVEILGATLALSPNGQDCWDGICSLKPEDSSKIADALAGTGDVHSVAAAVAAALAGYATAAYAPPDPLGSATIWDGDSYGQKITLASPDGNDEDTFTPFWFGDPANNFAVGWQSTFNKAWRVRIELSDEDLAEDDTVGVVEIGHEDVVAALQHGEVYPVRVDDQGSGSILFINISAHAL